MKLFVIQFLFFYSEFFVNFFFRRDFFVVHALLNILSTPSIHWIEQVLNSKYTHIPNLNPGQCYSRNPWSVWLMKKTALFLSAGGSEVPIVLVGNKSDLSRQVSLENVLQTKAEFMNNCPYIETSAKFNLNVIKLFIELLQVSQSLYIYLSCMSYYFQMCLCSKFKTKFAERAPW